MEDCTRVIVAGLQAGIPVITTGPPGIGKTGWFRSLERERKWRIIQVIASVREPTDIGGWPVRTDTGVKLEPGAWAVEAMRLANDGQFVVVFFDEMRTVPAPTQAALLKVIHEGLVGDTLLPRSVRFAGAANSVEDSAGGVPLEPPMANRFMHVKWVLNQKSWCESMIGNQYEQQSELPDDAVKVLGSQRALVASFINRRPELLLSVPKAEDERDGPWPSPRTWDYAAHLWATVPDSNRGMREAMLAACVGLKPAGEFIRWEKEIDLPDPEEVLSGRFKGLLVDKERPDKTYAILSAVTSAVINKWTQVRYENGWKVLAKAAGQGGPDIGAAMIGPLYSSGKGKNTPDIREYIKPFVPMLKKAGYDI